MSWTSFLTQSGDHPLMLDSGHAELEALLSVPETVQHPGVVFLGHPNSLQGGSMNNKVVTTMARSCKELGLCSLRMNFRGVGRSSGTYDHGIGESEDLLSIVKQWQSSVDLGLPVLAGFSFGSYVTWRVAAQCAHRLLISIAPAVDRHNYEEFLPPPTPWEIIMGDADEVVPFNDVVQFAQKWKLPLHPFASTGHFFHGRLIDLRATFTDILQKSLSK